MQYSCALWDLDGTLVDTAYGITHTIARVFDESGIAYPSVEALNRFIGPPLLPAFAEYAGIPTEKSAELVRLYRKYYTDVGIYQCKVYEGIPETLSRLKQAGIFLCVATAKPETFAHTVLKHTGIFDYFDFVGGASFDTSRGNKDQVIRYVLESSGYAERKDEVIMIGDTENDVVGADKCGLDCLFVSYGFGKYDWLPSDVRKPIHVCRTPQSVADFLLV